jgi:DNA gyrase subunit B
MRRRSGLALITAGHLRRQAMMSCHNGRGEMNPEQLWETTSCGAQRVRVEPADQAGEVFATLMGDVVDLRYAFIQANALKAVNLDA